VAEDIVDDRRSTSSIGGMEMTRTRKRCGVTHFLRRFNATALTFAILQQLGTAPIRLQQVIIHTLQPILLSFIIILIIFMMRYPMMALFPVVFIMYEAVMFAYRTRLRIIKPVPAINDTEKNASRVEAFTNESARRLGADDNLHSTSLRRVAPEATPFSPSESSLVSWTREDMCSQPFSRDVDTPSGDLSDRPSAHQPKQWTQKPTYAGSPSLEDNVPKIRQLKGDHEDDKDGGGGGDHDDLHGVSVDATCAHSGKVTSSYRNGSMRNNKKGNYQSPAGLQVDDTAPTRRPFATYRSLKHPEAAMRSAVECERQASSASKVACADRYRDSKKIRPRHWTSTPRAVTAAAAAGAVRNKAEDINFAWREDSDEYRLLYQLPITPFVNSHGERVKRWQINAERKARMKADCDGFKRDGEKARSEVGRKKVMDEVWKEYQWRRDRYGGGSLR
jgi:hypothetical protein